MVSLIAALWVLTAAHCVEREKEANIQVSSHGHCHPCELAGTFLNAAVMLGEQEYYDGDESIHHEMRQNVKKIIVHHKWNPVYQSWINY